MDIQLLLALLVGVAVVVGCILKTRLDPFPALLLGAVATGLVAQVPPLDLVGMITTGFGATLSSIGIVIGLGVALGKLLENTGGADALATAFVKAFGKNREPEAMAATGAIVSVPVFCDTGFVMIHPLAKSLAFKAKASVVALSIALAGGLVLSHTLIPPTPGPLAIAGLLGVDLGQLILAGGAFIILLLPIVVAYARIIGPKLEKYRDPQLDEIDPVVETKVPTMSAGKALVPIIIPMALIVFNTVSAAVAPGSAVQEFAGFIGSPPIALLIGLIVAAYLLPARGTDRKTVVSWLTEAAAAGGMIIFITGAGGAFARVLNDSGVGANLADGVQQLPLPLFLVPFVIASVVRVAQGSGTVAMITAATLAVPLVQAGGLNPVLAALACASGAFLFSYFNDSFFWIVTRFTGLTGTAALKMWSGMTTTIWVGTIPLLFIASAIL